MNAVKDASITPLLTLLTTDVPKLLLTYVDHIDLLTVKRYSVEIEIKRIGGQNQIHML